MSSQSDHYRRLFSGTLGVLPIVFPNRALGGTLVHFWRDCPTVHLSALATLHAMEMYDRKWWPILLRKLLVFGPTFYLDRDCKTALYSSGAVARFLRA